MCARSTERGVGTESQLGQCGVLDRFAPPPLLEATITVSGRIGVTLDDLVGEVYDPDLRDARARVQ